MYERMLDKTKMPTMDELAAYCGNMAEFFTLLNEWLSETYETEQKIVFPYGNNYGWGISHKKRKKLLCNVFAEKDAFTVMVRLTNKQCEIMYGKLQEYTRNYIDNKYPCNDGGWIHYRVLGKKHLEDIQTLLSVKCSC